MAVKRFEGMVDKTHGNEGGIDNFSDSDQDDGKTFKTGLIKFLQNLD